jgi:esterase/lipase
MTPEERAVLVQLEEQYNLLRNRYDRVLAACEQSGESEIVIANMKRQIAQALNEANDNWIEAQNRILGENEEKIAELMEAAQKTQTSIEKALDDLQDIKKSLNQITEAIKFVAGVVSKLT